MSSKSQPLKTSIYLYPDTQAILAEREAGPGTRSEVIRACIDRYAQICRREKPELAEEEWSLVFAALDGEWLAAGHSPIHVPATVEDLDRPGAKALARKLKDMFFSELVAVVDEAERHWASKAR